MRSTFRVVALASLMSLAACGEVSSSLPCHVAGNSFCSCDERSDPSVKTCKDLDTGDVDTKKASCNGTFSSTSLCPTDGRVGTCKIHGEYVRYYSDAASAEASCNLGALAALGDAEWVPN